VEVRRKENKTSKRVRVFKYLGKTFNEKITDKAHDEEGKKCSGMCLGNRREKVISEGE
jgi:hypothetical protein